MSMTHPYRVQVHCDKQMHQEIKKLAAERGLSRSQAVRLLVEKALTDQGGKIDYRLEEIDLKLESVLRAATAARVIATASAEAAGVELDKEEINKRIAKILKNYTRTFKVAL